MRKKQQAFLVATLVISASMGLLTGCSTASHMHTDDTGRAPSAASKAGEVQVYSTRNIGRPYEILGAVVASADGDDATKPVTQLKEEASKLGATMILDLRLEMDYGYWDIAVKASGLAAR